MVANMRPQARSVTIIARGYKRSAALAVLLLGASFTPACSGCNCAGDGPQVQKASNRPKETPAPPKPKVEPPPEIAKVDEPTGDANALRDTLLGLNKPPPAPEPEAPEPKVTRKPKRRTTTKATGATDFVPPPIGGLSDYDFQAAIGNWSGMRRCLAEKNNRDENPNGAIQLKLTINTDGSVAESTVLDSSTAVAKAIAPCVQRRARRIRFPSFEGKAETKTAKFVF